MTTPRMLTGGTYFFNFGFISLQECSFKVYRIKKPRPKARGEGLSRYHPNSPKKASARCGKSSL